MYLNGNTACSTKGVICCYLQGVPEKAGTNACGQYFKKKSCTFMLQDYTVLTSFTKKLQQTPDQSIAY